MKKEEITYGLYGWYWTMLNDRVGVVITSHRILNQCFPAKDGYRYQPGDEDIRYMSQNEFNVLKMKGRLRIEVPGASQADLRKMHDSKYGSDPYKLP